MDIREEYNKETGKYYYKSSSVDFEWSDEYVEWLENKLEESNSIVPDKINMANDFFDKLPKQNK